MRFCTVHFTRSLNNATKDEPRGQYSAHGRGMQLLDASTPQDYTDLVNLLRCKS